LTAGPSTGNGYVATLKLSIGVIEQRNFDRGLSGIAAYDRAEKQDAYIGQINMITASSFCGLGGLIWGYDLARADGLDDPGSVICSVKRHDGADLVVRSVEPLLDATYRLFGSAEQQRFPLQPGAMVICANKNATETGPKDVWCAIALAIAENRQTAACLFVEDVGHSRAGEEPIGIEELANCIVACGENQSVLYREVFAGIKVFHDVPDGSVACALTCAPYVQLARNAIPKSHTAGDLLTMSLSGWERAMELSPLPSMPREGLVAGAGD
jgi:histidine decarboxylase